MTKSQLHPLVFHGLTMKPLDRALKRLEETKLVSRHRLRRPGKNGGAEIIYQPAGRKSVGNVDHTLAIADVYCTFRELEREGVLVIEDYQAEPRAVIAGVDLRPDLALTFRKPPRSVQMWCEVDLGTERVPQLVRKLEAYCEAYERAEGLEVFPLVLVVTMDTKRAALMQRVIGELSVPKLFAVSTFDTLAMQIRG